MDTDVIDFEADRDFILQGFRMMGVFITYKPSVDVSIRLQYANNDSLIAERNGTFIGRTSKDDVSFEVLFPKGVYIRSGVKYTALSKMDPKQINSFCYYNTNGRKQLTCSGVTIKFSPPPHRKTIRKAIVGYGQIAAFIIRSSQC